MQTLEYTEDCMMFQNQMFAINKTLQHFMSMVTGYIREKLAAFQKHVVCIRKKKNV